MNKLAFALVALFATTSAFANEYDRYTAICKVSGTEQTITTNKKKLPYELSVKVNIATIAGKMETLRTVTKLTSEKNYDTKSAEAALSATVVGTASVTASCGARALNVKFGEIDARNLAMMIAMMGATNVPDLADALPTGKAAIGDLNLGDYCEGYYHDKLAHWDDSGPTLQIHFAPTKWEGLSYHIVLSSCRAQYIDPNGDSHRMGD